MRSLQIRLLSRRQVGLQQEESPHLGVDRFEPEARRLRQSSRVSPLLNTPATKIELSGHRRR